MSLRGVERGLFYLLLAAAVGITLIQRAFPSQDGPLHLYYIDVLANLLRGTGEYSKYFTIAHAVPPYAFHPYLQLLLNMVFDPLTGEKLLVSGYIVWFAISFRYLVHSVDPGNDWLPLLAFPFGLNRTLFLGFYNFSYAVATALFLAGYWLRHYDELTPRRSATYLGLTVLLALMHPIPLILGLMFVCAHVVFLVWTRSRRAGLSRAVRAYRWAGLHALWSVVPLAWIAHYTEAGRVGLARPNFMRLLTFAGSTLLAPFRPWGYRGPLAALSLGLLLLAAARFRKGGWQNRPADLALLAMAAFSVVMYVVAPHQINLNAHVPDRFPIFGIAFAAAFAAGIRLRRRTESAALACIAISASFLIGWQAVAKQGILHELASVLDAPPATQSARMAIIADKPIGLHGMYPNNFTPYVWAGAHYLRRSKAILLNGAWLRSPIMLVKPRVEAPCEYIDPQPMLMCLAASRGRQTVGGTPDGLIATEVPARLAERVAAELRMAPAFMNGHVRVYSR